MCIPKIFCCNSFLGENISGAAAGFRSTKKVALQMVKQLAVNGKVDILHSPHDVFEQTFTCIMEKPKSPIVKFQKAVQMCKL